jgi:hypothetical protein
VSYTVGTSGEDWRSRARPAARWQGSGGAEFARMAGFGIDDASAQRYLAYVDLVGKIRAAVNYDGPDDPHVALGILRALRDLLAEFDAGAPGRPDGPEAT